LAYQALYRVWRPQTFLDVVGQEHVTKTLQNALLQQKISHAYLFFKLLYFDLGNPKPNCNFILCLVLIIS
jgi:hypothetical protein